MNRAYSFIALKSIGDPEQRLIQGTATDVSPDRVGDVVESRGAQFRLPLPLLLDHDHRSAVGEVIDAEVCETSIRFTAKLARIDEPGPVRDLVEGAWHLVRSGLRKAVSIGFRPLEREVMPSGGWHFKSWEWLELSLVSVPAAAGATIDSIKSLDRQRRAELGRGWNCYPIPGLGRQSGRVVRLGPEDYRAAGSTTPPAAAPVSRALADMAVRGGQRDLSEVVGSGLATVSQATDKALADIASRLARLERDHRV